MPVVRVRQREGRNQRLISGDQRVARILVHERPCALKLVTGEIRTLFQHAPDPLFMDVSRPAPRKRSVNARCISRSRSGAG